MPEPFVEKEGTEAGSSYEKRGYLHSEFKLFHIRDCLSKTIDYHYHEFDKIVIFLSGQVTYAIEGKSYRLAPGDILLVGHNEIHRPVIDPDVPYERLILWILPEFISRYKKEGTDLSTCFTMAKESGNALLRLSVEEQAALRRILAELEQAKEEEFAGELYATTLFLQFFIRLNRSMQHTSLGILADTVSYNTRIIEILTYINANLDKDLSVEHLSETFYISRYHLMRTFKEETGYTLHNYIKKKRLLHAADLIRDGVPATKACFDCGFTDYSTFQRAFKTVFQTTPSSLKSGGLT